MSIPDPSNLQNEIVQDSLRTREGRRLPMASKQAAAQEDPRAVALQELGAAGVFSSFSQRSLLQCVCVPVHTLMPICTC